ncbi:MAG: DUF3291 domain-containing protein [Gammaproteobacteria bacterium]
MAQLNIADMRYTTEDPAMADFVAALDEVNAAAEASPGFIWRLKGDINNATDIRIFGRDDLLVNLSLWASVESLKAYVMADKHLKIMRRRAEWFRPATKPMLVLWWHPPQSMPTVQLAEQKLIKLRDEGPSQAAFDFRTPFPSGD